MALLSAQLNKMSEFVVPFVDGHSVSVFSTLSAEMSACPLNVGYFIGFFFTGKTVKWNGELRKKVLLRFTGMNLTKSFYVGFALLC